MRRLDAATEADPTARRTAIVVGAVFVIASVPKFAFFGFELEQFERFNLPFPEALVILAGVVELGGGVALLLRRWVAPALALLIPTMLVAIASSGLLQGDVIPSLTVAPVLLVGLAFLAWRGGQANGSRAVSPSKRRKSRSRV